MYTRQRAEFVQSLFCFASKAVALSGVPTIHVPAFMCQHSTEYVLEPLVRGQETNNYDLEVLPSTMAIENTKLTGDGIKSCTGDEMCHFQVLLHDLYENRCGSNGEKIVIEVKEPEDIHPDYKGGMQVITSDNQDGTWDMKYRAGPVGMFDFYVIIDGEYLPKNPFKVAVTPGHPVCSKSVVLPNSTCNSLQAGEDYEVVVQLRDAFNNPLTLRDTAELAVSQPCERGLVEKFDREDGTFMVRGSCQLAGSFPMHLHITSEYDRNGCAISGSPLDLHVRGASPKAEQCVLVGSIPSEQVVATKSHVIVQVSDSFGNKRTAGGDKAKFAVELVHNDGGAPVMGEVVDLEDGTYKMYYKALVEGDYQLFIKYDESNIRESPFKVHLWPGPLTPSKSKLYIDPPQEMVAGEHVQFRIRPFDAFGNSLRSRNEDEPTVLVVTTNSVGENLTQSVNARSAGTAEGHHEVDFTITTAAKYSVDMRLKGESILGSPFPMHVRPDVSHAANGQALGLENGNRTRAGDKAQFEVLAFDKYHNAQAHQKDIVEVFLQSHDHDGRVKGDTETVVDGKYSLSFVATRSGRYRAEVSLPTVLLWLAGSFHVCMLCQCGGLRC